MTSIYEQALGSDFKRLHPEIQRRFGYSSDDHIACVGRGVMTELWRGPFYTVPFLVLGTFRRIMFPNKATNVPFTIENYAYLDSFGRETVTWIRKFDIPNRPRRFDATMIYSQRRGRIVDYLGSHQHLAVDIDIRVGDNGGVRLRSGSQRFYEGLIGFKFPLIFSGIADVNEWYDDAAERFRIDVRVANHTWGPLFGYSGWFRADWRDCPPEHVPQDVKPLREERRE